MNLTWDPTKASENLRRHGIAFVDTENVFYDPYAITVEDASAVGEHRLATIGMDGFARLLVVVYTTRGDSIRLISARRASAREITDHEAQL